MKLDPKLKSPEIVHLGVQFDEESIFFQNEDLVWRFYPCLAVTTMESKYSHKVKSNLSFVNLGLGPVKKFVGQVIDASDIVTFFFIVTKCVSTLKHELNMPCFCSTVWYLDLTWLPFVFSWLSWIVFWILIGISVLDFALKFYIITVRHSGWIPTDPVMYLDWSDRPDVCVTIGAWKVTSVFLLDWTFIGNALWLHVLDFIKLATEVVARDIFVKLHIKTLDGTCQGSNRKDLN